MTAEKQTPEEIFHQALALADDGQRARFLDQACGDDAALRAEVENLLKWHGQANSFLEGPPGGVQATVVGVCQPEGPGTTIDRYELLELIGEGGMGLVYLAQQKEPVRRKVALKIIKPGMDSKQVIARFEAERQTLAVLDHPNIAHVLDAGCTSAGRPYFVMEHVRGLPITRYCDQNRLTIEQRLRLFEQVCEAVHHAHQKGIIHRDLKPSNILVCVHDDRAVPKIIDFGIAKAITSPLTDKTLVTFQGQLLGTPEYMSPEQVNLATEDIDTRSDIYSLGVVLYELLTGVLPFENDFFAKGGLAEMQRTVREIEAVSPSTRVTSLGDRARIIAESRGTHALALARRLHRELEWIPMKAMRKDRCRRYRSASEMADDVRNYLNGLPLIAGPETAAYRVRKFVSNHAGSVATVALVATAIVLGLVVSTTMYLKAEEARKEEVAARMEAEDAREKERKARGEIETARRDAEVARDEARQRAETIETMVPVYGYDIWPVTHRWGRLAMDLPISELIAGTASLVFEQEFKGPDILRAGAYSFFAHTCENLGRYEEAGTYFEKTLDIRRRELGEADPLTIVSANNLGLLHMKMGRLSEAASLLLESLETSRSKLGQDHNVTGDATKCLAMVLQTLASKAMDRYREGDYETAATMLSREDELRRSVLQSPSEPRVLAGLAMAQHRLGRNGEAQASLSRLRDRCNGNETVLEPHQRCLWEAETVLAASDSILVEIWRQIETGQLRQAAEGLVQIKAAPDRQRADALDGITKAMARAHYCAGSRSYRRGGPVEETVENYQAAVRFDPMLAAAWNDLARIQASTPSQELRNARNAIENATNACELAQWKNPLYLDTLAAGYAESGDFKAAIKRQEDALALLSKEERAGQEAAMQQRLDLYKMRKPYRVALARGAIAWWKLDQPTDGIVADSSGNGLHGRLVGNPQWQPGITADAIAFPDKADHVDCGRNPAFDTADEITVAAWIRVSSFARFCENIVARGESSWRLQRWWESDCLEFACTGTTVETQLHTSGVMGRVSVNDGQWHHAVGTYDGTQLRLYVDGRLDNSEPAYGKITSSDQPIYIGQSPDAPFRKDRHWNGLIDDVRIYSYAFTAEEVEKLYRETGSEASQQ